MKLPGYKFWFLLFLILSAIALFIVRLSAQAISLPSRTIEIANQASDFAPSPVKSWNFLDKVQEAKDLVASSSLDLKVGKKDIVYYERRITLSRGIPVETKKRLTDPEREIALVILDINSGELHLIKITERGNELTYPIGYEIENVERSNGITNNAWNTCRKVIEPENKAVILNVWPHYVTIKVAKPVRNKAGKVIRTNYVNKEVVENVVYVPYCEEIHLPELVESGQKYRKSVPKQAAEILRERRVKSKAFPDKLIAEVIDEGKYLKIEYFEGLPLVEHMDYGEFTLDPRKSAERVDVIFGTNLNQAYNLTCSGAKACGALQYTKKTWNSMDRGYPSADLPLFEVGVRDHVTSVVAAMLLFDNNLAAALKEFGPKILDDPVRLGEMGFAHYNGGTVRPNKSYRASILQSLEDWLISPMRAETQQYIEKWRFVREIYNQ